MYGSQQAKISKESRQLSEELKSVKTQISKKRKAVDAEEECIRRRSSRVTIVVFAEGTGPAELSLTYVVMKAWWKPIYDLRASIASDSKSQSTVALHYRASITQQTGEDWKGVALTLSTASPLQGTKVPTLNPYWIGEKVHEEILLGSSYSPTSPVATMSMNGPGAAPPQSSMRPMMRLPARAHSPMATSAAPPPPDVFRSVNSEAVTGAVSTMFTIPGLSTIPSDSSTSQQTHKVTIAELDFNSVDLEWVTVPKSNSNVFLQCKVKNTSEYVLLPGQANVFLNGSFVAKSAITVRTFFQNSWVRIGFDDIVFIARKPARKFPMFARCRSSHPRNIPSSFRED